MMKAALAKNTLADYDYINVETGFSYTAKRNMIGSDGARMGLTKYFDISPNGQYNYLLDYIQAPMDVPNPTGVTRGFYYWNSEAIGVYGAGHKLGEAISDTQRSLFNGGDTSIQEMGSNQPGKSGDMTEGLYAYLHRGASKAVSSSVYTPLSSTADTHNVAPASSITLSQDTVTLAVGNGSGYIRPSHRRTHFSASTASHIPPAILPSPGCMRAAWWKGANRALLPSPPPWAASRTLYR